MTKEQWSKIIGVVLTAVIALLAVFGYDVIVDRPREQQLAEIAGSGFAVQTETGHNTACYMEQGGAQFTCDSGGEIEINSGGVLDINAGATATIEDLTIGDDLTVTGDLTLSGALLNSSTAITLTAGQTVTPTYGLYILSATGAVSMTLAACNAPGQQVFLYGDDNQTITVNDTNIRSTDGNAVTLGQYDMVGFMCSGTEWDHLFKSANS